MNLATFNNMTLEDAREVVAHWCACQRWVKQVVSNRPYESVSQLAAGASQTWSGMDKADHLEAFAAHPVIGDVALLRQKFADTARAEQGQVLHANDSVIEELAQLNRRYYDTFGFIFIVFASGKSAAEMRDILQDRIDNSKQQELANAAAEQEKIMLARLKQTFEADVD